MDECGGLEREARAFQNEVLDALEGDIPVLGVVKAGLTGWTDEIRGHPKVRLLTVDRSNRDMMPLLIADSIRQMLL
jgi:nucleoside-triphosphatase